MPPNAKDLYQTFTDSTGFDPNTANPGMLGGDYNWTNPYGIDRRGGPERIKLTGIREKATLPENIDWQRDNPELAAVYAYRNPWEYSQSTGNQIGQSIQSALGDPNNRFKQLARHGALPAGAALGAGGAAVGYGVGSILELLQQGQGPNWSKLLAALLGIGGAGLGAYAGRNHTKQASFMGDPKRDLVKLLESDLSMSFSDKAQLMLVLQGVQTQQATKILSMLRGAAGAGVGALIAKHLLGMGLGGQILLGLVGGKLGSNFGTGRKFSNNALGERTNPGYNAFGQPFRKF
jgi:hypothetical protein